MKINKLIIRSFGKFQNKTIDFSEGFNMLYGENEAGKSTIHSFVEGVFYGFYKANLKNKRNTDTYDQYFPWENSNDYSGAIVFEDEGRTLRLERNFMKGHDSVTVFDELTGEEVTESYDYDQVTKLYDPALRHLGINQNTYRNTVSVSQLNSQTGEELIDEIKSNLMNYGETNTTDVSLTNIKSQIADKKSAIGTQRGKKSDFGKTLKRIEALEEELEMTLKAQENIKSIQLDHNVLVDGLSEAEQKKHLIEKSMIQFKDSEFEENYNRAKEVQAEIEALNTQLTELDFYNEVSKEELNGAIDTFNNLDVNKRECQLIEERINEVNQTIENNRKEIESIENQTVDIGTSEKLIRDVFKFEEFENQKNIVAGRINPKTLEDAKFNKDKSDGSVKKFKSGFLVLLVLTVFFGLVKVFEYIKVLVLDDALSGGIKETIDGIHGVIAMPIVSWLTLTVFIVLFVLTIIFGVRRKSAAEKAGDFERIITREEEEKHIVEERLVEIKGKQKAILNKYDCSELVELQTLKDKKAQEELFYTESYKNVGKLEDDILVLRDKAVSERVRLEEKQKEIEETKSSIDAIMTRLGVENIEGLRFALDKQYEYQRVAQEKLNKIDMLKQVTKGESFEMLNMTLNDDLDESQNFIQVDSYEELEEELRLVNEVIVELNRKISEAETLITNEESALRSIAEIEDQLANKQNKLQVLTKKREALDLLEETFEDLSKETSTSFAPSLNDEISKMIAIATDYRYTEVKVSPDMDITIVDNDLNRMVKVSSLSAGTIDLMYFALRIGLADLIGGDKKLPLVLDDSFVNYDDRRLVKVLEMMAKLDRQVIMFSCRAREKQLISRIALQSNVQTL